MNLEKKLKELISILTKYLDGDVSTDSLQTFVWDVIDFFSTTEKSNLPPIAEFEKVFWYVIWEVQHLITEDHLADGSAQREMMEALEYLKGKKDLPDNYIGRRP